MSDTVRKVCHGARWAHDRAPAFLAMSTYTAFEGECDYCLDMFGWCPQGYCQLNEWPYDDKFQGYDICRRCWAEVDTLLLEEEGEDYRPDDWTPDSWFAIAAHCDRCEAYDNCFKPEIESGEGILDDEYRLCYTCFKDYHYVSNWGCDVCGADVLCWREDDYNTCPDCYKECEDSEEEEAPPPPQKRPRAGPPQQVAPPPTVEVNARQRNLRDQRKLREWYPNHCTYHLFYHHVMQRPITAGCSLAKEGDTHCRQGGRNRSHECPDDLAERDLEAFKQ